MSNNILVRCSDCGGIFKHKTPKGGDGSGFFPARHKYNGKICIGYKFEGEVVTDKK